MGPVHVGSALSARATAQACGAAPGHREDAAEEPPAERGARARGPAPAETLLSPSAARGCAPKRHPRPHARVHARYKAWGCVHVGRCLARSPRRPNAFKTHEGGWRDEDASARRNAWQRALWALWAPGTHCGGAKWARRAQWARNVDGRAMGLNAERVARAGRAAVARVGALRYAPSRAAHHALPVRRPSPAPDLGIWSERLPHGPGRQADEYGDHTMACSWSAALWSTVTVAGLLWGLRTRWRTCCSGPQVGTLSAAQSCA